MHAKGRDGTNELKEYKKALENLKAARGNNGTEAEIEALKEAQDGHLKAVAEHEQERVDAAGGFFSLYANLLLVKAREARDKILSHQIGFTCRWT